LICPIAASSRAVKDAGNAANPSGAADACPVVRTHFNIFFMALRLVASGIREGISSQVKVATG
jgi:hypothetical protein